MAFGRHSSARLGSSWLVAMSIGLCAFTCLPLMNLAMLVGAEVSSASFPREKEEETSQEELVVCSAGRCSTYSSRQRESRPHSLEDEHCRLSATGRTPEIVGHHLANGLLAPLLN